MVRQPRTSSSKFVPWEPFKAAPAANRNGICPDGPVTDNLIRYKLPKNRCDNDMETPNGTNGVAQAYCEQNGLTESAFNGADARAMHSAAEIKSKVESKSVTNDADASSGNPEAELRQAVQFLESELAVERKLNAELKNLMVATMSEDLTCQISSLTEDKVRLAQKMSTFSQQMSSDRVWAEDLQIHKDVYKSKYEAVRIQAEELKNQKNDTLGHLSIGQQLIKELLTNATPDLMERARLFAEYDFSTLFHRSPCDEKVVTRSPLTSNITVSCCQNCSGREIHLL